LYWCELEEHSLRVFKNRVLRKIFDPKKGEVTDNQRKFCKDSLPHSSPNTVQMIKARRIKWAICHTWGRCLYRVFVEKPEGKKHLGRSCHIWKGKIKMDL